MPRLFLAILCFPLAVHAHGPTPQKIDESVTLHAPPDKVWAAVREFGRPDFWNPAVAKSESSGGNAPGARRVLTLKNGESVEEALDTYDESQFEYRYRLAKENLKALPVSSYSGGLKLTAIEGGTKLTWYARAYRGDTGNEPPENLSDEAATQALKALFRAGLDHLRKQLESGK
ncbi:SRPBCC family protein [Methylococcus sp. EFPC2]|nr:SRPBCC family protein [Methylococcus sp. EFPC2]